MRLQTVFSWLMLMTCGGQISHAAAPISDTKLRDFSAAILSSRCISCHGIDKQEGSLRLDSRADALTGGDSGPAFVPGDPDASLIIQAVRQTHDSLAMPPKEKLRDVQVALLERWIKAGGIWPNDVLILFDEEQAFVDSLMQGKSQARTESHDTFSGTLAVALTPKERFAYQIDNWKIPIREAPKGGEYRYLRLAWKKIGAGGAMFEIANQGQWPPEKASPPPKGRYVIGENSSGLDALVINESVPAEWTAVTIDLWKDLGEFELTGLSLMNLGAGEVLFDKILLARSVTELDAYETGQGRKAFESGPSTTRVGDAWSDVSNPVFQTFGGERLDLWSFIPPARSALPVVKNRDWCKGPVDRLVLAQLEATQLTPSAEADRRTLIRRLYFDLLGLPPSPDEVQAFLADPSDKAYETLVDRLLENPHYGERWGKHWLDVVRYADTNGYERDEFRPTAYRYRDYVSQSFNADKPYDQFIREQLAGDEMVDSFPQNQTDVDRLIATGFLRAGQFDSTAPIFQEQARARDQLMADLTNTTCSAFLGLTVSCANCHDHKYDPLLQADHFRLRAFFAAVRSNDNLVIDLPPQRQEIESHNANVDIQIAAVAKQISEIVDPVKQTIIDKRTAEFPEDIRQLLAMPANTRDDAAREKLKPFEAKLVVSDADLTAALSEEQKKSRDQLQAEVDKLSKTKRAFTTTLAMQDDGQNAQPTHIFYQGDHTSPRDQVPPGFLSVLDPNPAVIVPPRSGTTGRRTALANWIASPENPFTARVMVNRIWQYHFGVPLVATPNDFGYSGALPTNQALLDWLACEFVECGWSVKHMHRLLLLSATYRQQSLFDSSRSTLDPENHLLWRQNVQRLDADAMRDAMLAVSGKLLPYREGKPLWPAVPQDILHSQPAILEAYKGGSGDRLQDWYADPEEKTDVRSIFLVVKRSMPLPFMQVFDLPDPNTSCARRDVTTVAPQALNLLNSEFAVRMAKAFADRVLAEAGNDPAAQIERATWLALSRSATAEEQEVFAKLIQSHAATDADGKHSQAGLVAVCRVLLNVNEFIYLD
jgi:hypothetical protein